MFLLVGLGNIGAEYAETRHNVGFMVLDEIIRLYNLIPHSSKFNASTFSGIICNEKIIAIKPTTFMNNSGIAVAKTKNFYKIQNDKIIVFQDDLDLSFCKIKLKLGGNSAGHNGIKSIDSMIGNDYFRIKIGIDRPSFKSDIIDYVLNKFKKDEAAKLKKLIVSIATNLPELLQNKKDNFINKIHLEQQGF